MMFAETSNDFMGNLITAISVLIGIVGAAFGIYSAVRNKSRVQLEPQPIETRRAANRYNHDLTEQRFTDHDRRIGSLEEWRDGIGEKLEETKTEIVESANAGREKIHKRLNNQSRLLYLMCGKLGLNVSRDDEEEE